MTPEENYVLEVSPQRCGKMFSHIGKLTYDVNVLTQEPEKVKLVVFTGGEDIDPSMYDHPKNDKTFSSLERDLYEQRIFKLANSLNIPCMGICRGSQFLCVMAGGTLCQHLDNHAGRRHTVETFKGETFEVNSSHHQMQMPPENAVVLAFADPRMSKAYHFKKNEKFDPKYEYESVYYPNINAIGVQWHPEWLDEKDRAVTFVKEIVDLLVQGKKEELTNHGEK
jgi:gamma-glutamyl-gamma-aminobutyrate hydrolase PuuD